MKRRAFRDTIIAISRARIQPFSRSVSGFSAGQFGAPPSSHLVASIWRKCLAKKIGKREAFTHLACGLRLNVSECKVTVARYFAPRFSRPDSSERSRLSRAMQVKGTVFSLLPLQKEKKGETNAIFFSGSVNSFYCSTTMVSTVDGKEAASTRS